MQFRLASEEEALEIVSDPAIVKRIQVVPKSITRQPWIVEDGGHRLLAVFWLVAPGVYEAHIAMLRRDVIASRWLAYNLLKWLFSNGAGKVVTNCPSGPIANLARKLGMREVVRVDHQTVYFEVSPWELVQQSEVVPY